jgi:hypothetical protein
MESMNLGHHSTFQSATALILLAAARAADAQNEYPTLEPDGEVLAAEGGDFAKDCLARVTEMAENLDFAVAGEPVLTRSERWGLIWRVDFAYRDSNYLVNRFVCAQHGRGGPAIVVAIGQDLVPLSRRPLPGVLVH